MEIPPAKKRKLNLSKYIPELMIESILSKLPVKSLVRFMSVSKNWSSLITNPSFSNLRSNLASNVLVLDEDSDFLTIDRASKSLITLPSPFATSYKKIMGSCNGLVCISRTGYYEDIIVWNPCTGIFREVPNPSCPLGSSDCSYGFGYDSLSNDFKIVLAVEQHLDDSHSCFYYVEVFSLKCNSWKRIHYAVNPLDSIVGEPGYSMRGTHIDGVLYWNLHEEILYAFDLGLETFSIMPPPRREGYIGTLDSCLSFTDSTGIWILKCCGDLNSWVKIISLTTKDDIRPLYMTKAGIVAKDEIRPLYTEDLLSSERIIAKRFVEDQFEDIVAIAVPSGRISRVFEIGEGGSMCDAIAYVEGLISPTALIDVNTETGVV